MTVKPYLDIAIPFKEAIGKEKTKWKNLFVEFTALFLSPFFVLLHS